VLVVPALELPERFTEIIQISEGTNPQQLLLERAEESFNAPFSFGLSYEGRRRFHAQEADLA
jgi:hypothetical protein